jgi:polyisoprenoid-binding protein YceI
MPAALGAGVGLALALAVVGPALRLASAQSSVAAQAPALVPASAPESPSDAPSGAIRFVGRNLIATARGVFHRWRIREHRLDPTRLEQAFAVVEVDLASVDTDNARRDTHLRHPDFFGVETHPTATVRVHSARRAGTSSEGHPLYEASFDVDLHGVKKTLPGEIELVAGGGGGGAALAAEPVAAELVFEGRLMIDRTDFEIGPSPSRWNPLAIDREIPVSFRVAFPIGQESALGDSGP